MQLKLYPIYILNICFHFDSYNRLTQVFTRASIKSLHQKKPSSLSLTVSETVFFLWINPLGKFDFGPSILDLHPAASALSGVSLKVQRRRRQVGQRGGRATRSERLRRETAEKQPGATSQIDKQKMTQQPLRLFLVLGSQLRMCLSVQRRASVEHRGCSLVL